MDFYTFWVIRGQAKSLKLDFIRQRKAGIRNLRASI